MKHSLFSSVVVVGRPKSVRESIFTFNSSSTGPSNNCKCCKASCISDSEVTENA